MRGIVAATLVVAALLASRPARAQDADAGPADAALADAAPADAGPADAALADAAPDESDAESVFETVVVGRRPRLADPSADQDRTDGETLRASPRGSTLEALAQQTAGLYVSARGVLHGVASGASGGMHLRGLGGSPNTQILVVEDGVPDAQGIFGHPIPDAYIPVLLDEAVVVKGADSVRYGGGAMGGAVVLSSRWREREGLEVWQDAAAGSYATARETVALLARQGALDVAAGLFALTSAGHRAGAGGAELVAITGLRWRVASSLELTARNKVVHLGGADPGPASHPYVDHGFDVWRDGASLTVTWRRDDARLIVVPYLTVGLHRLYDGFRSVDASAGARAELTLRPRSADLLLGLAAEHVDGTIENRVTGERPEVVGRGGLAAYGQVTLRPAGRLEVVGGGRVHLGSEVGVVLLYQAGVHLRITDRLSLRARAARAFREPTIRELYLPYPTANPDLRPEYALSVDAAAAYQAGPVEVVLTAYRTEARDLIRTFGVWPSAEVVNVGRAVILGLEGSVAYRAGSLAAYLTGDWQDVGVYTRQSPRAKLNLTVEGSATAGAHRLVASLSGEWVHGLYMADYERQPIDDVLVVDLTLRDRHVAAGRGLTIEPYLMIRNLLDRRYAYVADYPMPGLNVLFGLRVGM
jgi:outer membrane receptor protein involved in Fe transport